MPNELISLDRLRAELRDGKRPATGVYRLQVANPLVVDENARTIRFVFSDGSLDRVGDTINPNGWDTSAYLKNPVVLWAHDSWSPPIGKGSNLAVEAQALCGDVEFARPEDYEFADLIYRLVKAKFINAGSVGFLPLEYSFSSDKDRPFGMDFERQELLEYSICPVPANPNALAEARAKGIDTRPLVTWAEKTLDGVGRAALPKSELEQLRRLAQEPHSRSGSEKWRCGAARDLPLDDSDAWDGPAAAKRMLDAAGFDGDSPDPAKARKGFLVYDDANPDLRSSYKEPFADIVDGRLKAVKGGVRAAASRLPQTDAPQSVLDEARKVLDHYEERFDMNTAKTGAKRRDGMSGTDPASGGYIANCGRDLSEECGLKNPEECEIHGPALNENKGLLVTLRSIIGAAIKESGLIPAGDPKEHLTRACEHVKAAHKCMKDLVIIDPDGDENLMGDDDQQEAMRGMHAHAKAADTYLESCRSSLGGAKASPRRREANPMAEGLDEMGPGEHLKRACEHIEAAHKCMKALPEDGDVGGNPEAEESMREMHAHVKAADGYLEHSRHLLDVGDPEAEKAARLTRLRNLRKP